MKKLYAFILYISFVLAFTPLGVYAKANDENRLIPDEAYQCAEANFKDCASFAVASKLIDSDKNVYLGTPYVLDTTGTNDEMVYFPLMQGENMILSMCCVHTTDGWRLIGTEPFSSDISDAVEDIENSDDTEAIGDVLVFDEDLNVTTDEIESNMDELDNSEVENIEEEKEEVIDSMEPVDIDELGTNINVKTAIEGAPTLQSFTHGGRKGKAILLRQKKQGRLPICWACTVATIFNTVKNRNITGEWVAKQNVGGMRGASAETSKKALRSLGLKYRFSNAHNNFSYVITNINNKYPLYAGFHASGSGHAVTICGYAKKGNRCCVKVWNSGNAKFQILCFREGEKVVLPYNSKSFVWTLTISKY